MEVQDIEAHLSRVLAALQEKNIHVLPGGTLERYLPLFAGAEFDPTADQKRDAVLAELDVMSNITSEEELSARYTDLYNSVQRFPSKSSVDLDVVLRRRLASYVRGFQQTVVQYPDWDHEQVQDRMNSTLPEYADVFSIQHFEHQSEKKFQATILITDLLNQGSKIVHISDQTNAGMGEFAIKSADIE